MRFLGIGKLRATTPPPPPPAPTATGSASLSTSTLPLASPHTPAAHTPGSSSPLQGREEGRPQYPQTFHDMGLEVVGPKKWYKPSTWNNTPGALRAPTPAASATNTPASSQIHLPPAHAISWDHDLTGAFPAAAATASTSTPAPAEFTTRRAVANHHGPVNEAVVPRPSESPIPRPAGPTPDHPRNNPQAALDQARADLFNRTGAQPPQPGHQNYGLDYYGI